MSIFLILVSSMFFVSLPPDTISAVTPSEAFGSEFDAKVEEFLEETGVSSCAYIAINDTETVLIRGWGELPGNDTVYYLGGVSAILTAFSVMKLYEDGLLDLEDNINDYLPYVLSNPVHTYTPITILQLLTHTSTIKNTPTYWDIIENKTIAFPDYLYELLHVNGSLYGSSWFTSEPGTYLYTADITYDLLAYIIEIVAATNYTDYVTDNILVPLGMTNTKANYSEYDQAKIAQGHIIGDYGASTPIPLRNYDGRGSMGWLTTVEDYAKFAYFYMHGTYNGITILNQTTIDTMKIDYGNNNGICYYLDYDVFENQYIGTDNIGGIPFYNIGVVNEIFFDDYIGHAALYAGYLAGDTGFDVSNYMKYVVDTIRSLIPTETEPEETSMYFIPIICSIALLTLLISNRRRKGS